MTSNPYIVYVGEVLLYTESDSIWGKICGGARVFVRPGMGAGAA